MRQNYENQKKTIHYQGPSKKALKVTVRWMPSHLANKPNAIRPDDVTDSDIIGNDLADKYAGIASELVQVPLNVAVKCEHYYKLVKLIQKG